MLSTATDTLALNPQGLDALRLQAKNGGKESVRAAASQFESYFMQMMLRSMRQTLSQDGPFDSQETNTFSDMFDQQLAQTISKGQGIGLADMLAKQIELSTQAKPSIQLQPRPYDLQPLAPQPPAVTRPLQTAPVETELNQRNFVNKLWPHAVDAANELGVSPHVLLAQAALETGWGKHAVQGESGNSYNLFNIKAGKNWTGAKVGADTTEYINGKPVQQAASFRAYGSYAESFADFARQIKTNPRYAAALDQGGNAEGFARGLQAGGYATDPAYADKIMRVINSAAFRENLASAQVEQPAI